MYSFFLHYYCGRPQVSPYVCILNLFIYRPTAFLQLTRVKELSTTQGTLIFIKVFYSFESVLKQVKQRKGGPPLFEERRFIKTTKFAHFYFI